MTNDRKNDLDTQTRDAVSKDAMSESFQQALRSSVIVVRCVLALLFVFVLVDGIRYIDEGTIGLKQRCGQYVRDAQGRIRVYKPESRFVFVWPQPIETLHIIPLTTQSVILDDHFWPMVNTAKAIELGKEIIPEPFLDPSLSGYNLTGDLNIVHSQWQIEYRVSDPVRYMLAMQGANTPIEVKQKVEQCLASLVQNSVIRHMASVSVNDVLTADMSSRIWQDVQGVLKQDERYDRWGVEVTAVNNRRIVPPGIAQEAFNRVTGALSEKRKLESEARVAANALLAETEAQSNRIIKDAQVDKRRYVEQTKSDAVVLEQLVEKFSNNSQGLAVFLQQRRQDFLRDILEGANLYIVPEGHANMIQIGPAPEESAAKTL